MNEHFCEFINFGHRIAIERGVNWHLRLKENGIAISEDAWNLTKFVGDSPPPTHWMRDFGSDDKTLAELNNRRLHQNLPPLGKVPFSQHWIDFLKSVVSVQLFFKKNTTQHVVSNVLRPIRVLATSSSGKEPWELKAEDVELAYELAREIQPSGKLANDIIGVVKTQFDANHIPDIGPISPALSINRLSIRNKRARFTKSTEELRKELEERKHAEKLPERRAFWELCRIVFTENPRSFLDHLRFAQIKVMLLCGLRVGEASLLPADWKRVRTYYDASGRQAGELGGYSKSILLRHFAEKQQSENYDSAALFETTQYIPEIFREILEETLDNIVRLTQPLRETLQRQVQENRILPWFARDQLVLAAELYPYLTGNPNLLSYSEEQEIWKERYRTNFENSIFDDLHEKQIGKLKNEYQSPTLNTAVYVYYNRLKGKIPLRKKNGLPWSDGKVVWSKAYFRIDEMEDYLTSLPTKLSDKTPFRLSPKGEINPWDLMFLMPKRALSEGRNDGLCDINRYYSVGRFDSGMIMKSLSTSSPSTPSLFENYGHTEEDRSLSLNSHALRHLQNTELFRLGIADTIITKRFNRKSVVQSHEYDHRSLAEELEHIDIPPEVEVTLGSNAATVARMIKAGKASGPVVETFKRIQKTQGDEAAFAFLKVEADGFHSTPYGHCINSFTVDPCPKHLECFSGCRHLSATSLPNHRAGLVNLEEKFKVAIEIIAARPSQTVGKGNQLAHAQSRLDAVRKILATPAGEAVFPNGNDLSEMVQIRSILDDK